MKVTTDSKIYIACPANLATGGPELLHQLCNKLSKMGKNAFMYYVDRKSSDLSPTPKEYEKYEVQFSEEIIDNNVNILIVPETHSFLIFDFKNIQKSIWWLSIDNFIKPRQGRVWYKKIYDILTFNNKYHNLEILHSLNVSMFAQSHYAVMFLQKEGFENVLLLSDYLNNDFIEENPDLEKQDIILYNPKKGKVFTDKIINSSPVGFKWVPLENMSRQELKECLLRAKVYIDFGEHPGKDRIPREAAMCGCCVITGKKGSAAYFQDVPISGKYKITDDVENIPIVLKTINECLENYEIAIKDFDDYRTFIRNEEMLFDNSVLKYFKLYDE